MTTTWKSSDNKLNDNKSGDEKRINQKFSTQTTNKPVDDPISGTTLTSWSRQQKFAMIACFAILGVLLALSACSKQEPKPALVGVSGPAAEPALAPAIATASTATVAAPTAPAKKTPKKRPANVMYSDANSGISFLYPRKFALASGEKAQPQLAGLGDVSMNFVEPGGITIATVGVPANSYPGTDFASAFFNVNVNRNVSEQQCSHFAFVDTRNADGEPVDAEKVKIGDSEMEMTSSFSASDTTQAETQYYHNYENGACYEYVLGLGTEGVTTEGGMKHVDRDQVFAKLEKILATVKINAVEGKPAVESEATGTNAGKNKTSLQG
jgi:hypothetical protein